MTEHQIRKAQAEGQFDNLAGAGKPLPRHGGDDVEAAGFRIMAEAGVVPREIALRKAVAAQRERLQAAVAGERRAEMAKLAALELRLAIEEEARRKYLGTY